MYIENRWRPTLPHSCPCSTIGAGARSRLFSEARWPANQEDVRTAIQLYDALTSDAESRVISTRPKGVKRAVITSVLAMKRVGPLLLQFPTKNPRQTKRPTGVYIYKIGGDLLSHTVAHAVPSAQESLTSVFGMRTGGASPL